MQKQSLHLRQSQVYSLLQQQQLRVLREDYEALRQELNALSQQNPFLEERLAGHRAPLRQGTGNAHSVEMADTRRDWRAELALALPPGLKPPLRFAVLALINRLDSHGFLTDEQTALRQSLGLSAPVFRQALNILQTLEGGGIGTFGAGDYLAFQMRRLHYPPAWQAVCLHHLDKVARKQTGAIAKLVGISPEEAMACCQAILTLQPYPLRGMAEEDRGLQPLVELEIRLEEGEPVARLVQPLSERYALSAHAALFQRGKKAGEDEQGLIQQLQSARFLLVALKRRENTLWRIGDLIAREQAAFFKGGSLLAFSQARAAQQLKMHPSTISRALQGKYLASNRGHYPLAAFFSTGKPGHLSANSIRRLVAQMVLAAGEARLSDRAIAQTLAQRHGIAISRRTVAKYRQQQNLPSAYFKLGPV